MQLDPVIMRQAASTTPTPFATPHWRGMYGTQY